MENKRKEKYISLHKLHCSRKIYWIRSFQTLRKWVEEDINGRNILQAHVKENRRTGRRFYIPKENIKEYIKAYNKAEIFQGKH